MSDFMFAAEKAGYGPLHTGSVKPDDARVIDDDFKRNPNGPNPTSTGPFTEVPLQRPVLCGRLLSGTQVINPTFDQPTQILPADARRKSVTLLVTAPDVVFSGVTAQAYTSGQAANLSIPAGALLRGFRVNYDAGASAQNGQVVIFNTTGSLPLYDFTTSTTGPTLIVDDYNIPLAPGNTPIQIAISALASGPAYTIDAYYYLPLSNFVTISDDKGKLQVDPNTGALANAAGGRLYANSGDQTLVLADYTGPVWASAAGSSSACSISYWGVTA